MNAFKQEAKELSKEIANMRETAIELRQNGGEPSDNFKRRLCIKAARLKELKENSDA